MKRKVYVMLQLCMVFLIFTSCGGANKSTSAGLQTQEKSDNVSEDGKANAIKDTAVVISVDTENGIVNLQSVSTWQDMMLNFTGGCDVQNKYGEIMSMTELKGGEVVEISYESSKSKLYSLQISDTAWEYKGVKGPEIDEIEKRMVINGKNYKFDNNLVIISEGESAMLMDINEADTLIIRGIGKDVCSLYVDKGHGYVRLQDEEYFLDGYVTIGEEVVKKVTAGMMLVVPEGNYNLNIQKNGIGGTKNITVSRNEETIVDVGDLKGAEIEQGAVKFNLTPKEAVLYIDGVQVNHNELLTLKYGKHKIVASADGYNVYSGTLKVQSVLKELDITLKSSETDNGNTTVTPGVTVTPGITVTPQATQAAKVTGIVTPGLNATPIVTPQVNIVSSGEEGTGDTQIAEEAANESSDTSTNTGSSKIQVTAPAGAEVYLDGNYMGLAPVSFHKTSGTHTITLRKDGYKTKSYTVYLDDSSEDTTYTFSDMVAE